MPCQSFQRGFGRQVINAGEHNASIRQHAFERQGAFAAAYFFRRTARILAVQHGLPIRESVIRFDRHGIQQRFSALPAEALHSSGVRQTGIFAAFRIDAVEVGVVAILCEIRRRRDIGDLLPVGADLHLREEIIHKKIIKLKLFHAISCLSGRGDRRCVRNKMGNWCAFFGDGENAKNARGCFGTLWLFFVAGISPLRRQQGGQIDKVCDYPLCAKSTLEAR